jgi:hypothetical protein
MTPEEISKLQKIEDKKKKLHEKYKKEKLQNYENNDVRNETLEQLIIGFYKNHTGLKPENEQELILRKNKTSIDYYYKNKERLDNKRKELYQQQKEQISKQNRVLTKCKKILKYDMRSHAGFSTRIIA